MKNVKKILIVAVLIASLFLINISQAKTYNIILNYTEAECETGTSESASL